MGVATNSTRRLAEAEAKASIKGAENEKKKYRSIFCDTTSFGDSQVGVCRVGVLKYYTRIVLKYYTRIVLKYYTQIVLKYYTRIVLKYYTLKYYTRIVLKYYTRIVLKYYTRILLKYYTQIVYMVK